MNSNRTSVRFSAKQKAPMPNIKARNTAAKRLQKIDHFLDLIVKMSPDLDSKDCDLVAEYLSRRVRMVCKDVLKENYNNAYNVKVKVTGQPNKHDVFCSKCGCWHDEAIYKRSFDDVDENSL